MTRTPKFLAFDLGAESGRAILGHFADDKLQISEIHRFPNRPVRLPGAYHWNVFHLWAEIKHGLTIAAKGHGSDLVSVGIDTWGVDFGLLDKQGTLIANPVHYRDDRTDGMLDYAFQEVPKSNIFEQTGIQFMQFNSLYQLLSLVVKKSPILDMAETFLMMPDLLHYWLTGRKACEFTNATTTQAYNPRQRDWARPLLEDLNIPTHIFPEVVQPATPLGPLQPSVAREVGISHPLKVVTPACHDTGSAVAGVPSHGENFAWISSGTWSIIGVNVDEAVINEQTLAFNLTNEGGVNNTFRLSKNVMGLWLIQECKRSWLIQGDDYDYNKLFFMTTRIKNNYIFIDPDHEDFLKPGDMPSRIQSFCRKTGQPIPESHGAIIRCVLESLALKYRFILEQLESVSGRQLETIYIVGGGTQNTLLNQFTADATGRQVVAGPVEATAIGNLVVQAVGFNHFSSLHEGSELIRQSFETVIYDPSHTTIWNDAYGRFREILDKSLHALAI